MSINNDDSTDDAREAEVVLDSGETTLSGDVIKDATTGNLLLRLIGKQIDSSQELPGVPMKNRDTATIWAQITDKDGVSHRLLQQGESLLAWVRFKRGDGTFTTEKAVLFSLGTVAAITITRRVVRHYKSR